MLDTADQLTIDPLWICMASATIPPLVGLLTMGAERAPALVVRRLGVARGVAGCS